MKKRVIDYIPRRDDDFFNFQGNLVNKVTTHIAAWGIPETAFKMLAEQRSIYEPLYHKAQDKKRRTSVDVHNHRRARKEYEKAIRVFVKAYLLFNPSIPEGEKVGMGLRVPDREPTPKPKINVSPIVGLRSTGGVIEVRCRALTDQTRPSLLRDAEALEVRFTITEADAPPPTDFSKCPQVMMSTKARFLINLGPSQIGKRFYGFFRWANLRRPENSGPWSDVQTIFIS